ncbi:MAG TPA: hypothetical protein VE046_11295 [Steroidobacteraceae bacterium]|nr:hypothetical protein [Steroidobacteraceae bacterium]
MPPVTVTTAESLPEPPVPVQVSVKVLVAAVSVPVLAEPAVALAPVQAPDAVQAAALVVLQVRVEDAPLATLVGAALRFTVGAGFAVTVTVADFIVVPPVPVHDSVYVLVAVNAPVLAVPVSGWLPDHAPPAVHVVALEEDQVRIEAAPLKTLVGLAVSETVGGAGSAVVVTVAD